MPPTRHIIGTMTGTSLDGLDAALVQIAGHGLAMRAALLDSRTVPLGRLAEPLAALAAGGAMPPGEIAALNAEFSRFHVEVIGDLAGDALSEVDLIAVHGQTIYHDPPISWQLINPSMIARETGRPVVADLRAADLAAGGQGAPITPLADWILFRHPHQSTAVINLGGFCNSTILPSGDDPANIDSIQGFDVCACNQLLNAIARQMWNEPFDENGQRAAHGQVDPQAADALLKQLQHQRDTPRSLGTGDEAHQWITQHKPRLTGEDLAASAVHAMARCIAESVTNANVARAFVAGGGAQNKTLVNAINQHTAMPTQPTDTLDIPVTFREAVAIAILGVLAQDNIPITLPQITGCSPAVPRAGVWCFST